MNRTISLTLTFGAIALGGCSLSQHLTGSRETESSGVVALKPVESSPSAPGVVTASFEQRVANPQAKTIRFEGQEIVLGNGQCRNLSSEELIRQVRNLLENNKKRSARALIAMHRSTGHHLILQQWASNSSDTTLLLVAQTLDELHYASADNYQSLLKLASSHPKDAKSYAEQRLVVMGNVNQGSSKIVEADSLVSQAHGLSHQLLVMDAAWLRGLMQSAGEQTLAALETFSQAAGIARELPSPALVAEMSLFACDAANKGGKTDQAASLWKAAVIAELSAMSRSGTVDSGFLPEIDSVFWEEADRHRPADTVWPQEIGVAVSPWAQRIELSMSTESSTDTLLWAAIAQAQLATGQPELALISLKRAEQHASQTNRPWLRIAQARCLSAQGQSTIAATILAGEIENENQNIRVAAMATLGSIKMQTGAVEQGATMLNSALVENPNAHWNWRIDAEADLANARIVLGNLDQGLTALRSVQQRYLIMRRWQSYIQSLENEAEMLTADKRNKEAEEVRRRIREIEQS